MGRLRRVTAGAKPMPPICPRGETSVATLGSKNMNAQTLWTPLTKDDPVSLEWLSAGTPRVAIPAAHIENLLAIESKAGEEDADLTSGRKIPRTPEDYSRIPTSVNVVIGLMVGILFGAIVVKALLY
jgi:hypothetical protein